MKDDFQDNNSIGWTTSGGSWSMVTDGSIRYRQTATTGNTVGTVSAGSFSDFTASAKVKMTGGGSGANGPGMLFRASNISNGYLFQLRIPDDEVRLYRIVGGTGVLLDSASYAASQDTEYTLRVVANGTSIECFVNGGSPVLQAADSQFGSGRIGFRVWNTAFSIDDVIVTE